MAAFNSNIIKSNNVYTFPRHFFDFYFSKTLSTYFKILKYLIPKFFCTFATCMANKLTIDEGNSSTKIALWHDQTMASVVTHPTLAPQVLHTLIPEGERIDSAIVCSVRRRNPQEIIDILAPFTSSVIILSSSTRLPITIDYRTPATLGPDRIAAAVGATVIMPDQTCLVVDMGTAITYDVVSSAAHFVGGNIAPGIFVRLEALNHFTSALPLVETDGDVPRWGYDTTTALRSGAIRGVIGELQYYRHCIPKRHRPKVILTGGSTHLITPYITTPITVEPHLVLIGLNRILDYNEIP